MKDYFYSQCLFILCSFFISFHRPKFFVLYYLSGEGGANSGHLSLIENIKMIGWGRSLVVPWLRLSTSTAGGLCSISGQGTKILHTLWCGQKIKNKRKSMYAETRRDTCNFMISQSKIFLCKAEWLEPKVMYKFC